ncbi:MAG: hypothetical protein JXC32_07560, partial [Anaerolineae bacterium]|nr:hypothetical protein [Anaerolineae bacterium]
MRAWRGVFRALVGIFVAVASAACDQLPLSLESQPRPTATPARLAQWASAAAASSHYALPDWSPNRATGAPDVLACADDARAWASARGNGVEWLQLAFPQPVRAVEVRIYQTYGRGAISRVTLMDASGASSVVWEGVDETSPCPGLLAIVLEPTEAPVSTV